ncbi:MAG TPA: hypothetical protein VFC46_01450 [Humisphaera sp.]|nr:hypothetical protein [Humisphaera sp.]
MTSGNIDSIIRRILVTAALLGIALPLADGLKRLRKTTRPAPIDSRYSTIAAAIPDEPTLGYISDLRDRGAGITLFLQAQYALAPHVLLEGGSHRFTIANLQDPTKLAALCAENDLTPVMVDRAGVALLRRKAAP